MIGAPGAGAAGTGRARIGGRRRALAFASALLLAGATPAACGERRDAERVAALEAGIASAQASLAALSADAPAPSAPPVQGDSATAIPFRPIGAASAAAATNAAAAAAPSPSGGPRPLATAALLGAGPDALRRWFGEPDLRRPEGGAEVRLYLGPGCALDVVLYAERGGGGGGGGPRVSHAAARAEGAAPVTEAECLRDIGGGHGAGGGAGRAAAAGHSGRR